MYILEIPLGMEWFRQANKYIESLYHQTLDKWTGNVTIKKTDDKGFEDEFDSIIKQLGF